MDLVKFGKYMCIFLLCHPLVECQNVDFADRAFVSVWNAPSAVCESKFGVQLNLSYFDIVANHNETFEGDEIVIFYGLGLLPSINGAGEYINGGLPQLANITAHLDTVTRDVERYMRYTSFNGLAVIDYEAWRPMFVRDGFNKVMRRYIQASQDVVRKKHPDWSGKEIYLEAQKEFETGARTFIQSTLDTCRKLRPRGYWGLYMFPECYNRGHKDKQCYKSEQKLNNRLAWMFNASTALYPSIYLSESRTPTDRYDHVYGELKETLRVKKLYGGKYLPIVPYSRIRYRDTLNFYSQADLNSTILQVADAGLNAIAFWGSSSSFRSKSQCEQLQDYLDSTLGPFVRNVTLNARKCSAELCKSHGRCFKTDWSYKSKAPETLFFESASKGFLTRLFEKMLRVISGAFWEIGNTTNESDDTGDLYRRHSGYSCSCFEGWAGQYCLQRSVPL